MSDGVIIFDMTGKAILCNDAGASMYGYASAQAMLKDLSEFHVLTMCKNLDWRADSARRLGQRCRARAYQGNRRSEHKLIVQRIDIDREWYVEFSGEPVYDKSGRQILAILVMRDITESKKASLALEQALSDRDEFLSIASHELKTPLTTLKLQLRSP